MTSYKRYLSFLAGSFLLGFSVFAQKPEVTIKTEINTYLNSMPIPLSLPKNGDGCKVEKVIIDEKGKTIEIVGNEFFASQPFTDQWVTDIYQNVRKRLPKEYRNYELSIMGRYYPIEQLVPNGVSNKEDKTKLWSKKYKTTPWVTALDRPYEITHGLQGRHLAVWASHGRYFRQDQNKWKWQRPNLFTTNEDLLTQTFVVPYLIPMLENAGANVFSPRERSWQKHEVIVDNDQPGRQGNYLTNEKKYPWVKSGKGFQAVKDIYYEGDNPFQDGTSVIAPAVSKKSQASTITWLPQIPQPGEYAVYVSYPQSPDLVSDATYTVIHQGISSHFRVNQKMGGGTWVYLGTFYFDQDNSLRNSIQLSNLSEEEGLVGADAVRLGGGMGNIARGTEECPPTTSGLPRYLEGARYFAQWAGMPYEVYSSKNGTNDYADDINARSRMTNYLAGGSCYLPSDCGLNVPIESSIAIHSDAGVRKDNSYVGTLGIYTTQTDDGVFPEGMSRLASRDLCDLVMRQVHQDMNKLLGGWSRRQLFDRNYSETRVPQIPAMILETLSHQNFADMKKAHDPYFKFHFSRAIYKGILKYMAGQRKQDYVVQPLPVSRFATSINMERQTISLSWSPTADMLELSAKPTGYIVYTQKGDKGFDNGFYVKYPRLTIEAEPNTIYRFKVCAVNDGGMSFPSETLTAYISERTNATVLIVNGFQRLAGPQPMENETTQGFDLYQDPGIFLNNYPGYCGSQICFNRENAGIEGSEGLGFSGDELTGMLVAGNTFDYPYEHGKAIAASGLYSFASCSREAVEQGDVRMHDYNAVDLITGLQKDDGYSMQSYKIFTRRMQSAIREYLRMRGRLFVSGAFVGSDMLGVEEQQFTQNFLKYQSSGRVKSEHVDHINGMNISFNIYNRLNEEHYAPSWVDCITPTYESFAVMLYNNQASAGVAYAGRDYKCMVLGFPFECIRQDDVKEKMMRGILNFLLTK